MCLSCVSAIAPPDEPVVVVVVVVVGVPVNVPVLVVPVLLLLVVVTELRGVNAKGIERPFVPPETNPDPRLRVTSLLASITITSTTTSALALSMSWKSFSTSATLSTMYRTNTTI